MSGIFRVDVEKGHLGWKHLQEGRVDTLRRVESWAGLKLRAGKQGEAS